MPKNNNRIAVYSRKSKFTGKGESIGNQIELSREYIQAHYGHTSPDDIIIYEDEGFSGGNLNRPGFKQMMKAARERKFKAIIVYRLDRISRNVSDFSALIEELSKLDIAFVSIREQFDTGTPMGRAMMYIASVFSQLERETIAERIRDNMHELAKTGRWLGGITPTGYASESIKSVTVDGKSKKVCRLKLIPEEADVVRLIYELYIENKSQTLTEAELIKKNIKTKNKNYYTRFSIKAILQNPVYVIADEDVFNYFSSMNAELFSDKATFDSIHGILAYNRTDQEKGRATQLRPVSEWIVAVGQHRGIIPGKIWVDVQRSLEQNKSKSYRKPRSNEAIVTGLLFCSCGNRMYPKLSSRQTQDGKPVYTYVCKMKERSQGSVCDSPNVNGNLLDELIIGQIKLLEESRKTFTAKLEQNRKFFSGSRSDYESRLSLLYREKADLEKKIELLIDSLTELQGSSAKVNIARRIEKLNYEHQAIDMRIKESEALTSQSTLGDNELNHICKMLSKFSSCIDEMTLEEKRSAAHSLIQRIVWNNGNAQIFLTDSSDTADF